METRLLYYLFSLFILFSNSCVASSFFIIDVKEANQQKTNLLDFLHVLNTTSDEGTVLFKDVSKDLPVNKPYTFTLELHNNTADTIIRILSFGDWYIVTSKVQIHFFGDQPIVKINNPTNIARLSFLPGQKILVRFTLEELDRINPDRVSVNLYQPEFWQLEIQRMHVTQAFFLGLFAFLCVFNLIIFFVTQWKLYLKYVLYIFCALVYFLYYFGFWQSWFPSVQQLSVNLVYTWYSMIFISYFIFLNEFGNYRIYVPKAYLLLNIGIIFKSSETLINTLFHFLNIDFIYHPVYVYTILGFEIVLMVFILFFIIKNKSVQGRLIILASCFLIIGGIMEQLKLTSVIDPVYFIQLGIVFELLTFSAGLGYLTKQYYQEKRKNQQLYIEQLRENEKIQKNLNIQLEEKVKIRTEELENEKHLVEQKNKENELLMMELQHRVKNNLQVIVSLLNMQERNEENLDARKALMSGKNRIRAIELIHKMLQHTGGVQQIRIEEYINLLFKYCTESHLLNGDEVEIKIKAEALHLESRLAVPIGLIMHELIVNSCKYAVSPLEKLVLEVELNERGEDLYITYRDNGPGTPEELHLSKSLGFKIISVLVEQIHGELEIFHKNGLEYQIVLKKYRTVI